MYNICMSAIAPSKNRHPDQSPYNWRSLICASFFKNYCHDNGVQVSEETLERLHQIGMLFPALRVEHGVGEMRKITKMENGKVTECYVCADQLAVHVPLSVDEQPYYMRNGLMTGNTHDWLKFYEMHDMAHVPTSETFMPWKQHCSPDFVRDPNEAEMFSYLYDRHQLYAVKIALERCGRWDFDVRPSQLILNEETRQRIREYYRFLAFYLETKEMGRSWDTKKQELFEHYLKENEQNTREAERDWKSHFKAEEAKKLRLEADVIAKRHGMTVEIIKKWRSFLVDQSVFTEWRSRRKAFKTYQQMASVNALINAEDCNFMVYELQQFLLIWKNERSTLKEVLLGVEGMGCISCVECGSLFEPLPNTKNPKFCMDYCKRKYEAAKKREERMRKKMKI